MRPTGTISKTCFSRPAFQDLLFVQHAARPGHIFIPVGLFSPLLSHWRLPQSEDPVSGPASRCEPRSRRETARLLPGSDFSAHFRASSTGRMNDLPQVICPSGIFVSSPLCKNISLHPSGKSSLQIRAIPPHNRGVSRSSRTRGADAVDAAAFCARWVAGRVDKACERSPSERTRDVAADGEVVWS